MIKSGDWIVPHYVGVKYFEKPVLGYWANALSILLFGHNEFAVRFPGALAAFLVALSVFYLLKRFGSSLETAFLGGLIYLSSIMVFAIGTISVLDNVFTLWVTLSIVCFFVATESGTGKAQESKQTFLWLILSGIFAGFSCMTKGFLAFAFPVITLAPYLVWQKKLWRWVPHAIVVILLGLITLLPWGLAIHKADGDFWNYFFWEEHIKRFLSDNAQHSEGPAFFIPLLIAGLVPWIVIVPAAIQGLRKNTLSSLAKLSVCWFIFPFLFLSISRGKLPTYILPCFAPLSILIALGLSNYYQLHKFTALKRGFQVWAFVLVIATLAFIGIELVPWSGTMRGLTEVGSIPKMISIAIVLSLGIPFVISAAKNIDKKSSIYLFACSILPLYLGSSFLLPRKLIFDRAPGFSIEQIRSEIDSNTAVISDFRIASSLSWYLDRQDNYFVFDPNEFTYGLTHFTGVDRWLKTREEIEVFIKRETDAGRKVVLVYKAKHFDKMRGEFPPPKYEHRKGILMISAY